MLVSNKNEKSLNLEESKKRDALRKEILKNIREYAKKSNIRNDRDINLAKFIKFTDYLFVKGVLTESQYNDVKNTKVDGDRIGDVLVEKGYITYEEKTKELTMYKALAKTPLLYLLANIKNKIGQDRYQEVVKKRDEMKDVNILEVLHLLQIMPYSYQKTFIYEVFSPFLDNLIYGDKQLIKSDVNGKVVFYMDTEDGRIEVLPKWIPSFVDEKPQVIVSFEEYNRLYGFSSSKKDNLDNDPDINLPFIFRDIAIDAISSGASDIHITYDRKGNYRVLYRIADQLVEQPKFLLDSQKGRYLLKQIKIEAAQYAKGNYNADDIRKVQDARLVYDDLTMDGVDFRLVFIPDGLMEKQEVVGRILKREKIENPDLTKLGYYPDDVEVIKKASNRLGGIFIISGITNSGKSTALAHIVAGLPKYKKIETVEDPIEYIIPGVNVVQHQIYEPLDGEGKVSFNEYIKGFKRADPDIIMISEIRKNPELVEALIESARAGQLIFSTIHINSAFDIYKAFYDLFKVDLATTTQLILFSMNQILVPKLCDNCKKIDDKNLNKKKLEEIRDELPFINTDSLGDFLNNESVVTYIKGDGCDACNGNGYKGRVVVYEYFYPTAKFVNWLLTDKSGIVSKYAVESKVYEMGIGKNRLEIFIKRLKDGVIDVSERTVRGIM